MKATKKIQHGKKWMPAMYVAYYGILKELAKKHGYILCIHGSVVRDFDLVAVPFHEKVSTHDKLLSDIKFMIGEVEHNKEVFNKIGYEPHGRICYTIECGGGGYFDISFTPSMQQAIEKIKKDKIREKEMKKMLSEINKQTV